MGNSATTLGIRFDYDDEESVNAAARAGATLNGMVFAEVTKKIKAKELILYVEGYETCVVTSKNICRSGERPILQVTLPLRKFEENNISAGRYEFPFSFDLPGSLPSSMQVNKRERLSSWSAIEYKVIAKLDISGYFKDTINQVSRPLLIVSAPIPPDPVPFKVMPITKRLSALNILDRGSVTLGVSVDDTRIGRGQELKLELACKNDAVVDIHSVQVKVTEVVQWEVGDRFSSVKRLLVKDCGIQVPGLEKSKKPQKIRRSTSFRDIQDDRYRHIYEEMTSKQNVIALKIPETCLDSYSGSIVNCRHFLTVKIKTGRLIESPSVEIPLKIGTPPPRDGQSLDEHAAANAPPLPEDGLPIATVIPLDWSGVDRSSLVVVQADTIRLGGTAIEYERRVNDSTAEEPEWTPVPVPQLPSPLSTGEVATPNLYRASVYNSTTEEAEWTPVPVPSPVSPPSTEEVATPNLDRASPSPTISNLLDEMVASVSDFDILLEKIHDPDWKPVLATLTPQDYGSIIAHVNDDFDQPKVATLVAPQINGGRFTCLYCVEALRNTAEWNRIAMVQRLLPLCSDIEIGQSLVRDELNSWEVTVTSDDFAKALSE